MRKSDQDATQQPHSSDIPVDWKSFWESYPGDLCIHDLFHKQADKAPDAEAIYLPEGSWSYQQLQARIRFLAKRLRQLGVKPGVLVGVATERCPEMVAALYGIFEAGGAYVPIDPHYPEERVSFMLEDAQIQLLITQEHLLDKFEGLSVQTFLLEKEKTVELDVDLSEDRPTPEDLCYTMYTSGSTGRPKSAMNIHRGIVNLIDAMQDKPGLTKDDTTVAVISLSHDMSVSDIFLTLSVGARLVLANRESAKDGFVLSKLLQQVSATYMSATPSIFRMLVEVGWQPKVPMTLLSAGEPLPPDLLPSLFERGCTVWNGYGMTEASVYSTLTKITSIEGPVTIGGRMQNTTIYILDEVQKPVKLGESGELYVGGFGVGLGYWERPKLSKERFLPDPFVEHENGLMYRSGDLARFLPDGDIECLGRIDHQVKIRGFRVELGSIEAHLNEHSAVHVSALVAREDLSHNKRLLAYIVPQEDEGVDVGELHHILRAYLASTLPDYMVPSRFVTLEKLPLTPAGKIDRLALPEPSEDRPELAGEYIPPRTNQERIICELFAQVLGLEQVGAKDDFFFLGGHSILAARLAFRIHEQFCIELPSHQIFAFSTPARLALLLSQEKPSFAGPPLEPLSREDALPITYAQQGLWFIHQLDPTNVEYHIATIVTIKGKLHFSALEKALDALLDRQEALRATFSMEKGKPVQRIQPAQALPLPLVDLTHMPREDQEKQASYLAKDLFRRPYNLAEGPLLYALLLRMEGEHRLLVSTHHVVSDGWSINVFFEELVAFYEHFAEKTRQPELPILNIQAADYAAWQHSRLDGAFLEQHLRFWQEQLVGAPQTLSLPMDRPRPVTRSVEGEIFDIALPRSVCKKLRAFNKKEGTTLYMSLISAFAALLQSETSQADLPIGTVIANRSHLSVEHLISFFANTLVLRVRPERRHSFLQLVRQVKQNATAAYAHQELPFELLVQKLAPTRATDQQPLFQTCFILQDPPTKSLEAGGASFDILEVNNGTAPFDLTLQLWEVGDEIRGNFMFRKDIFERETIAYLAQRYVSILKTVLKAPETALSQLRPPTSLKLEDALLDLPEILDAAVFPRANQNGCVEQVAYVVSSQNIFTEKIAASVHKAVGSQPGRIVQVTSLPLNHAGTLDIERLFQVPVLDQDVQKRLEQALYQIPNAIGAMTMKQEWSAEQEQIHIEDILPQEYLNTSMLTEAESTPANKEKASVDASKEALEWGRDFDYPDWAPKTLPAALRRAAKVAPERGIYTVELDGQEYFVSYPDLLDDACRIAQGLHEQGHKHGDLAILQLSENRDFISGLWGCIFAGLIPIPLAAPLTYESASTQLEKLFNAWQMLEHPVVLSGPQNTEPLERLAKQRGLGSFRLAELLELRKSKPLGEKEHSPDDLVMMLLTSGSTGMSKAVSHHHKTIFSHTEAYNQHHNYTTDDTFLNWLPMDHVGGLFMCHIPAVYLAAQQIHTTTQAFLQDPLRWMDWIQQYKATVSWAPNFAFGLVNQESKRLQEDSWDLSTLRVMMNGGEAIVPKTARRFLEVLEPHGFPQSAMVPVWGMSELSSAVVTSLHFSREDTSDQDAFVCVGHAIPGFGMRIVDDAGRVMAPTEVGRLEVKGPSIMSGYYKLDDVNAKSFTDDRWFDTGDLAFIDHDGTLTITGRRKDVIIVNGINYYSHEIEAVVEDLPEIMRSFTAACAIRQKGAETDQLAIFFCPTSEDEKGHLETIKSIRGTVTRHVGITPTYILPVQPEQIPKTEIGKIQRTKLKVAFEEGKFASLVRKVDLLLQNDRTLPNWFFSRKWRPRRLSKSTHPLKKATLFIPESGPGLEWALEIQKQGLSLTLVLPDSTQLETIAAKFAKGTKIVSIDHKDADAYEELLTSLQAEEDSLSLIHLWTCGEPVDIDSPQRLLKSQELGIQSLTYLLRALQKTEVLSPKNPSFLLVASVNAQPVKNDEDVSFAHGPLIGAMTTIPHECIGLNSRHVDLSEASGKQCAIWLLSECAHPGRQELEVAYRQGLRWVPRLVQASSKIQETDTLGLEPGEPVVITGGLGGLGRVIAGAFLKRYQSKILLLGKTPFEALSEEAKEGYGQLQLQAQELKDQGAGCAYASVDVADADALRKLVEEHEDIWGKPTSVFVHLAARLRDTLLSKETPEGLAEVYGPKLLGTWNIGQLAARHTDTWLVDFSSVNAYFGGYSAGAYGAGGRFGEGYLQYLAKTHGVKARHMSWCRWKQIGMSRDLPGAQQAHAKGYQTLSVTAGLHSFFAGMYHAESAWIIGLNSTNIHIRRLLEETHTYREVLKGWITVPGNQAQSEEIQVQDDFGVPCRPWVQILHTLPREDVQTPVVLLREAKQVAHAAPTNENEKHIAEIWKEVLEVQKVGIDDNFFDLGGHSLLMTRVQHLLEEKFGKEIPIVELFRCPTIRTLSKALSLESPKAAAKKAKEIAADKEVKKERTKRQKRNIGKARKAMKNRKSKK